MKIIPITKLRNFYNSLSKLRFSSETQLNIAQDFNRKDNFQQLIALYNESKNHFAKKYDFNNEPFLSNASRKLLPSSVKSINRTQEVASIFENTKPFIAVVNSTDYNFEYIAREVSTIRTTKAEFDNGDSGKSSGNGGLDFIGWNIKKELPILGEIKVKGDQNPFYAVIQLLTYLSEISTPNQIDRIINTNLFKANLSKSNFNSFFLYIILTNDNFLKPKKADDKKYKIFIEAQKLVKRLEFSIPEIEEIVFLRMDSNTSDIFRL